MIALGRPRRTRLCLCSVATSISGAVVTRGSTWKKWAGIMFGTVRAANPKGHKQLVKHACQVDLGLAEGVICLLIVAVVFL